jgi:ribonucleoside-diphosphate reductase alpha chain
MVHGVTGGIEPMFAPVYFRRRYVDTGTAGKPKLVRTLVVPTDYIKHPDIAEGAYDLSPEQHFKMQYIVQQHIDSSVSKTINLPKAYPVGELSALWLKYLPYLKGATFYREGSRGEEPLEYVNKTDIPKLLSEWDGEIEYGGLDAQDCAAGICSI